MSQDDLTKDDQPLAPTARALSTFSRECRLRWWQIAVRTHFLLVAVSCQQQAKPIYSPAEFRAAVERRISAGQFAAATQLLRATDPVRLASVAAKVSDVKIFMIAEDTIFAPGIESETWGLSDRRLIWEIPGTSDVLESGEQVVWHEAAREFAEAYNLAILPYSDSPSTK